MDESPKNNSNTSLPKILLAVFVVVIIGGLIGLFLVKKNINEDFEEEPGGIPDHVALIVNGDEIEKDVYNSQLSAQVDYYREVYSGDNERLRSEEFLSGFDEIVREQLITEVLLTQYLAEEGIVIQQSEVKSRLQETVVDVSYDGDWEAYEENLLANKTTFSNMYSKVRRDLLVERVMEIKGFTPTGFEYSIWYSELRNKANVVVNQNL